jgi:phosphoribosylglycinamide formyltransferase-1
MTPWINNRRRSMPSKNMKQPDSMKETFVGDGITPEDASFSVSQMAMGTPGLPQKFSWKGKTYSILEVLEEWKEAGDCRHGSGERYVRKHWFRVRTNEDLEMKIYFERQTRSSGGSRWRLYSLLDPAPQSPK